MGERYASGWARLGRHIAAGAACLVLSATALAAQGGHATLSGVVADTTGAVLPNATVTSLHVATSQQRRVDTGSEGRYVLPDLGTGEHEVTAELPGFAAVRMRVVLSVGQSASLDFALPPAGVAEVVEVTEERVVGVERESSAYGQLVTRSQIETRPLNGRDFSELILLQPGAVEARSDRGDTLTGRGTKISVHGARTTQNVFLLDGTDILDALGRSSGSAQGVVSGIESVEEFTVLTNTYGAEHGRAAGGVFNIVTRSGSNTVRGSAFEFFRHDGLDARNYFETAKQPFERHQFGGALGGPLVRNRAFVFGTYEGLREQLTVTDVQAVPSLAARSGAFLPPGATIDPDVVPYLALIPLPTIDDPSGGRGTYVGTFLQPSVFDTFSARIDYVLSGSDTLFGRYTHTDSSLDFIDGEVFPGFENRGQNGQRFLTVGETHVFAPTVVNAFRFAVNRTSPREEPAPVDPFDELAFIPGQTVGTINITGFKRFGTDRNAPRSYAQTMIQVADDLTVVKGSHMLKLGFNVQHFDVRGESASRSRGEYTFNTFTDFLLARSRDFVGLSPGEDDTRRHHRQWLAGVYGQDDWKISNRLTLNLGLRYEFFTVPDEVDGKVTNVRYPTDPAVTVGPPLFENPSLNDVAPRVGFVFVPSAGRGWRRWFTGEDGDSSIRGGFGVYYEPVLYNVYGNMTFKHPPYFKQVRIANAPFPDVYPLLEDGQGLVDTFAIQYDPKSTYVYHYNLNLQRAIRSRTVVTLAYVGSRGINLWRESDFNIAIPANADGTEYPVVARPARRNPNFSNIRYKVADARSAYDALQTSVVARGRAFQGQVSYTLAKSVDDQSSSLGRNEFANGQARSVDPYNLSLNRGRSDFDVRHALTANFSYELPFGRGRALASGASALVDALVGGWRLSGIFTALSGVGVSPIYTFDQDRDATTDNEQRPDLRPGASIQPVSRTQLFDPNVFVLPPVGRRGTVGRNVIDGPGLVTLDVSLAKSFGVRMAGKPTVELRVDAFNVLNRANFAIPTVENLTVFTSPTERNSTAGQITSTSTPARQLQLAARVTF